MVITLDIEDDKKDIFLEFIKTLNYVKVKNKNDKFSEFRGMWENKDIKLEDIRKKAWK